MHDNAIRCRKKTQNKKHFACRTRKSVECATKLTTRKSSQTIKPQLPVAYLHTYYTYAYGYIFEFVDFIAACRESLMHVTAMWRAHNATTL